MSGNWLVFVRSQILSRHSVHPDHRLSKYYSSAVDSSTHPLAASEFSLKSNGKSILPVKIPSDVSLCDNLYVTNSTQSRAEAVHGILTIPYSDRFKIYSQYILSYCQHQSKIFQVLETKRRQTRRLITINDCTFLCQSIDLYSLAYIMTQRLCTCCLKYFISIFMHPV